ncbi:MAG: dockerin type I domain-containing protein [Acutalibacteraceae bacterium]
MKRIITLLLTLAIIMSAVFALPITANADEAAASDITYGDADSDGKINLLDLILMRKYLAKWNVDIDLAAADVKFDGNVNLLDLIQLRKYLAKWDVVLGPDYSEKTDKFVDIKDKIHLVGRGGYDKLALYLGFTDSGFEIKLNCEGDVSVRLSPGTSSAKVGIVIDGDYDAMQVQDISTAAKKVTLAEGLSRGIHTIRFIKLTEFGITKFTMKELTYCGYLLQADDYADSLKLEFYGDSITCGYGNLCTNGTSGAGGWKYQNGMQTYAAFAARALNAEFSVCSGSGYGIYTGYPYDPENPDNPRLNTTQTIDDIMNIGFWDKNNAAVDWDFSFDADVVVVNLGTNDQSFANIAKRELPDDEVYAKAKELVDTIRLHNPDCYIIWLGGAMGNYEGTYFHGATVLNKLADDTENMIFYNELTRSNAGGDGHPSVEQHKALAEQLVTLIRDTYGEQLGLK